MRWCERTTAKQTRVRRGPIALHVATVPTPTSNNPTSTPASLPKQPASSSGLPHVITADPRPASPRSTGLIPVTTWKGVPAATAVYVDDKKIVSISPDGHILGAWALPGNLPAIISGLTTAFGHSPLAATMGSYGWTYTWDGFVIRDYTPEVVGPTDPTYQWDVTVSHVDGVLVYTKNHISVGTSGDAAGAIADKLGIPGVFVAEILPVPLSAPATGSPRLWVEVIGGATQQDPITELRGPVGSWLSQFS